VTVVTVNLVFMKLPYWHSTEKTDATSYSCVSLIEAWKISVL